MIDAKKDDGGNYETSTIHTFSTLIGRYLKYNKLGNLDTDEEFQGARDVKMMLDDAARQLQLYVPTVTVVTVTVVKTVVHKIQLCTTTRDAW